MLMHAEMHGLAMGGENGWEWVGLGGGWLVGWLVVYLLIDQNDVLVPFPVVAAT